MKRQWPIEFSGPATVPEAPVARTGPDRLLLSQFLVAGAFVLCGLVRIHLPLAPTFDERHYAGAAIALTEGLVNNREHPMLAKEILAIVALIAGDSLTALRQSALFAAAAGLLLAGRALWWHSRDALASLAFTVLLATGCLLLGLARLALLEPFVFLFAALACYLWARERLLAASVAWGLAVACKWTAAPLAVAFFAWLLWRRDYRLFATCALAAGAIYLATFAPLLFAAEDPMGPASLPALHLAMAKALAGYLGGHAYQSQWWEWLYGGGHLFAASGHYAGADRMALVVANPLTALPAALAVLLCRDRAVIALFAASFALFPLSGKPVLMVHQFILPHALALAALALVVARMRKSIGIALLTGSVLVFAALLPIMTSGAAYLEGIYTTKNGIPPVLPEDRRVSARAAQCLSAPGACYP